MEVSNQPKLKFNGVDIVNVKFDAFTNYDNKTGIDLKVEPKVFYPEDSNTFFRIVMNVFIHCEIFFDLNILAIGNFEFDSEISDIELKKKICKYKCSRDNVSICKSFCNHTNFKLRKCNRFSNYSNTVFSWRASRNRTRFNRRMSESLNLGYSNNDILKLFCNLG